MIIEKRNCVNCDSTFTVIKWQRTKKYCSDACKRMYMREWRNAQQRIRKWQIIVNKIQAETEYEDRMVSIHYHGLMKKLDGLAVKFNNISKRL